MGNKNQTPYTEQTEQAKKKYNKKANMKEMPQDDEVMTHLYNAFKNDDPDSALQIVNLIKDGAKPALKSNVFRGGIKLIKSRLLFDNKDKKYTVTCCFEWIPKVLGYTCVSCHDYIRFKDFRGIEMYIENIKPVWLALIFSICDTITEKSDKGCGKTKWIDVFSHLVDLSDCSIMDTVFDFPVYLIMGSQNIFVETEKGIFNEILFFNYNKAYEKIIKTSNCTDPNLIFKFAAHAVKYINYDIIKNLPIKLCANWQYVDSGNTILHILCGKANIEDNPTALKIIECCVDSGVDVHAKNTKNQTASDFAFDNKNYKLCSEINRIYRQPEPKNETQLIY